MGDRNSSASFSTLAQHMLWEFTPGFQVWFGINVLLILVCVALFSLLGVVLISQPKAKSASSLLIIHQAFTESVMATLDYALLVTRAYRSQHNMYFPPWSCRHDAYENLIILAAAQYGLFQIALNRFIAISFPHYYKAWTTRTVIIIQIVSCWVIGFFCNFSFYLGFDGGFIQRSDREGFGYCTYGQARLPFLIATIFDTYLPLSAAGALYVTLFAGVYFGSGARAVGEAAQRSLAQRVRVAKMMFISSLLFCVCFAATPLVMNFATWIFMTGGIAKMWLRTVFFCGYLCTPITLLTYNRDYRATAAALLGKLSGREFFRGIRVGAPNHDKTASTVVK